MKKLILLSLCLGLYFGVKAAITVSVTNPNNTTPTLASSYSSLANAITAINNITAMRGPVIFNLAVGSTETAPAGGYLLGNSTLNALTSATNTLTFQKSGTGANPMITAFTGTTIDADGIWKIRGTDYVTIDGINLQENVANTTSTKQMEWGYAILKLSATDGTQNIAISNCNVTLNKANTASVGIYGGNHLATSTTQLTPTSAAGTNINIKINGCTVANCYNPISIKGYTTSSTYYDFGLEIGTTTGNTITNFGGFSVDAMGINVDGQTSAAIENNSIIGGSGNTWDVYGVHINVSCNGDLKINANTISVSSNSPSYNLYGILCNAPFSTLAVTNNIIQNCNFATATSGSFIGIFVYEFYAAGTVTTTGNTISGTTYSAPGLTGGGFFYGIKQGGTINVSILSSNVITNNCEFGYASGNFYGIAMDNANTVRITDNFIYNNTISSSGTSGSIYGIYADGDGMYGKTISGNSIYSNSAVASVYGIYQSSGSTKIFKNKIYDLKSTKDVGKVYGMYLDFGSGVDIYNNLIGDLRAPIRNQSDITPSVTGIYINEATPINVFYNTVNLNANSTGTNFGTATIYASTTAKVDLQNNILTNTSTANGAGKTSVYQRSAATLNNYASTSNNNLLYAGTPSATNLIMYDGANAYQTLADYKIAVGPTREGSSISENPVWLSTTGSDATYLHIDPTRATLIESGGAAIDAYTDDFDGNTRNTSKPDIGADEFTGARPAINTPSPTSLSSFATVINTVSSSQTFTVGGSLIDDLLITAPTGFEVRINGIGTFGSSLTITPISGVISTRTIEVRMATSALTGSPSGNVICSSTGATSQNVAVSGTVNVPEPTVTGNSPTNGTTVGGTSVVITGTNLTAATAVKFGSTNATSYTVNSPTQITAVSPAGTGTVDITVTTTGGTSATSSVDQFTYVAPPNVTTTVAGSITTTGATLNGSVNANNASTAVTFDYGLTTSYGTTVTATQSPLSGTTTTPVTIVISSLVPNTTYHYRVNGVNAGGTTNGTDLTFTTSAAAPSVTTAAASSITTTGATLNGTVNANNASTAVTFEYGLTTSYGTTVTASQSPVTGTTTTAVSYVLSGLVPNTTYHYRVNGVNTGGTTNGTDLTFTTTAAPPTVTTNAVSSITTTGATLNGTVNANNASTAVTFEYGLTTSYGTTVTATQSPAAGTTATAVSKAIIGLSSNTTYHYRVNGVNAGGTTNGTDLTFTTTAATSTVTTNAAGSITTTGATLNGLVNANNASTAVTFEYGLTTSYGTTVTATQSPVTGTTTTAVSCALSGLVPNTTYHYRVNGVNAGGTTNGTDLIFTTSSAAPTVTTNAVSSITTTGATLNGSVNANNASTAVTFDYGTTTSYGTNVTATPSPVTGTTATAVSKAITGLSSNTTYHFRVNGVNTAGTTNGQDQTFITSTIAPTVTTNVANTITSSSALLTGSSNPNGATATGWYRISSTNPGSGNDTFGTRIPSTGGVDLGMGTSTVPFSLICNGLNAGTTYYFCAISSNSQGTSIGAIQTFTTTVSAPTITGIAPTSGPTAGGTSVVITGTNLTGATAVKFGTTAVSSYTVNSPTQITATSPAGTGTVDVTVTTAGGTSATSSADQFTYAAAPTITGITATSGSIAGGTPVVITGTNFTGATAVKFGAMDATRFTIISDTKMAAISPAGTVGTVDITITTAGGTSATGTADLFTYLASTTVTWPLTATTGTAPNSYTGTGYIAYNQTTSKLPTVSYTGYAFDGTATAQNLSGSFIVAETPASLQQINDLNVYAEYALTAATGYNLTVSQFQMYLAGGGTNKISTNISYFVDDVSTTLNPLMLEMNSASVISYKNFENQNISVPAGSTLRIRVYPRNTGTISLSKYLVSNNVSITFTSTAILPPTITAVSPLSGSTSGGTSVVITGTDFTGATSVKFGSTNATSYTVNSATQITATSPAGTGTVDVTVTTVGGTSATSANDKFTYVTPPTVSAISPKNGPIIGGTLVSINGNSLFKTTAVKFGNKDAISFNVQNTLNLTAIAPAGTGTVDITIINPGGTSSTNTNDQFTYIAPPIISSISPSIGFSSGGTSVVISGTNFTNTTAVNFGATAATNFKIDSDTQITATAPAGTGTVDVTVTNAYYTSEKSTVDQFMYVVAPTTISVASTSGGLTAAIRAAGGDLNTLTNLTITGTINATDFKAICDIPSLTALDLKAVSIAAYQGTEGPSMGHDVSYPANEIPQNAFWNPWYTTSLNAITLPASITSIGDLAFENCYRLTERLTIPSSVTFIGSNAFADCTGLTSIYACPNIPVDLSSSSDVFNNINKSTCTLYVSTEKAKALYADADQWKNFIHIVSLAPTVTAISPANSSSSGGASVVIIGTNFTGTTAVKFGTTAASSFKIDSDTQITAIAPAGTGSVDITVTNAYYTSETSSVDQFTYVSPPTATTSLVTSVTSTGATLNGSVNANSLSATVTFEYGLTTGYGTSVTATQSPVTGTSNTTVSSALTGLTPNTMYHFRVKAVSPAGTTYGDDVTFTTLPKPMILTYNTALGVGNPNTITLPIRGTVNVLVDWGDGNSENFTSSTIYRRSHTYSSTGIYTVTIAGSCTEFGYGADATWSTDKLVSVTDFGDLGLTSLSGAFKNALNLTAMPATLPPTVTNLSYLFYGASNFNVDLSSWNTQNVIDMSYMFGEATTFNQEIGGWNVGNVTNMEGMFRFTNFNKDLSNWNVGNVTDMKYMFIYSTKFDQNIGNWDISKVTDMSSMFQGVTLSTLNYNALLTGWASKTVQQNVPFHAGSSKYNVGAPATARAKLTGTFNWTITDGGIVTVPPTATTQSATTITQNEATLNGSVNANDFSTTVTFEYGTTTSYGSTATAIQSPVTGTSATAVSCSLTGLTPNTMVHFRVKAVNSGGTTYGDDITFKTKGILPTITGISPTSGPTGGRTSVVITGTNFTGVTGVKFGTAAASSYTVNSDIQITATSPAGSAGAVDITVTTADGTSATSNVDQFTYFVAPTTISVVSTAAGLSAAITAAGGDLTTVTNLTITGTINDLDFKAMRDNMPKLAVLDISEATVVTYKGTDGTGNPGTEITYPDNEIPQFAFCDPLTYVAKTSLITVSLPLNSISIGRSSFEGCIGLKDELILPSTLLEIGVGAFSGCNKLSGGLNIPFKVKTIGNGAFGGCEGFTGSLILPESLLSIGSEAFVGCNFTGKLDLPSNLETIGGGAFLSCSGFTGSLTIPSKVTTIEETTFYECTGLSGTLIIPSGIITIKSQSFQSCEKLSSIIFEANSSLKTIEGYAFAYCTGLKGTLVIPNSGVFLHEAAFTRCTGLTSLTIPSSISAISDGTFAECTGLTSIFALPVIPVDLTSSPGVFDGVIKTTCKLYVPAGSKELYEKAIIWKDFYGNIVEGAVAPTVTTLPIVITCSSIAKGGGSIISLGDVNPTQHGVVWSTSHGPDISLTTKTSQGEINTVGDFKSDITGLVPETTYYIRAYATNNAGTSYGDELTFKTPKMSPIITSFTPASGIIGSLVTITGLDFNTVLTDNEVYIGSTKATITACTATSITFTIPTGSVSGRIKVVLSNGEQRQSYTDFVVIVAPTFTSTPVITVGYGQPYIYNVSANTGSDLTTTITAPTLPGWLTKSGENIGTVKSIGNFPAGEQFMGVTGDSEGNTYAIKYAENSDPLTIYKITSDGTTTFWKSGLMPGTVTELLVANGYIYIPRANESVNSITRIPLNHPEAAEENFASLTSGAFALTEKDGWIYASDYTSREIVRIKENDSKIKETILTSTDGIPRYGPIGLSFDQNGDLFIATFRNGSILKYNTSTSTLSTALTKLNYGVTSVKVDKYGNFYVALEMGGLRKYKPDFSSNELVSNSATDNVWGLSLTENGSILYSLYGTAQVYRIEPSVTLQGTPLKSDVGPHNVVLRATNSAGYADQTFIINVVDNVAPVVSTYSPAINATGVALQPTLSLTFDEEVSLGTTGVLSIYNGASLVKSYDLSVAADKALFTLSSDKKTVGITLTANLPVNTLFSVGLDAGFVKDKYDNSFAGFTAASNTWQFATLNKVTQTITYPAITPKTYGDAAFTLGDATTDKGLTVTYTAADPTVVSIVGNQATILKAGNTKITASQTGDNVTFAATAVERTLDVNKAALKITADNKSKVYDGLALSNFSVTYTGFVKNETATALTGTLVFSGTAATAVNAGLNYVIKPEGLTSNNYTVTFEDGKLDITKRAITLTADAKSKIYGNADPTLTVQVSSGTIVSGDVASGTLKRAVGENVNDYAISKDSYTFGSNYDETFVFANLTITKRPITITADAKSKVYGNADPTFTAQVTTGTIVTDDLATGSLTRAIGETVADYAISKGTYTYGSNYDETFVPANLTISKRPITLTADTKSKVYGNADPALTAQVSSGTIVSGDVASGSLTRAIGETVADYAITKGDYTFGANYDETFVSKNLSITKRPITITADAKSKVYGNADPTLTVQVSSGTIVSGDVASGSLTRAIGETVADYAISKGNYTYGSNYEETFVGAKLTIGKLSINVTAMTDTKVYDGTNSSSVTPVYDALVNGDVVNTVPTQVFNNANVGTTHVLTSSGLTIKNGAADATGNYSISYIPTGATGIITAKQVSVTNPTLNLRKVYDGSLEADVIAGFLSEVVMADINNVTLAATAAYSDANAGSGKIITVHYTLNGSASGNYIAPADYVYTLAAAEIVRKQLTISAPVVVTNKMLDGNSTAVITTTGTLQGVENVDANKVTVTATATYDNATVGSNKTITVVYTLSGSAKDNYLAPENYVITGAKISDNITLSPLATPAPGCENATLDLAYSILTGTPTQYKITFNQAALTAGIQNVSYTNLPTSNTIGNLSITIPKGTPDGDYQGTLQVKNELGTESPAYTFLFTINVSSDYIISKFDDVILCDNKSMRFATYQWYKDGVAIEGATKQFYNDPVGLIGSYSLKVTTVDGKTLYTCPKELNIALSKKVSAYPNPVKINQPCSVKVLGFEDKELEGAELSIFTLQGVRVCHSDKVERINSLILPSVQEIYIGHLTTANGKDYVFKVIVEK